MIHSLRQLHLSEYPRILIVRFSAIGDCVMTAWAVSALRRRWPRAYIAWAAESRCAPTIDSEALCDWVYSVPREQWKRETKQHSKFWKQLKYFSRLRREEFDVGLDFQGHSKTALCLRLAGPRVRLASRATDLFARSLNPVVSECSPHIHEVDKHFALVEQLSELSAPSLPIMPRLDQDIDEVQKRFDLPKQFVTIQTGAGSPAKRYPAELWAEVASLLEASCVSCVFVGAPGDPRIGSPKGSDLVGRLNLRQTMATLLMGQAHLAGDTGTGHIAAAYGVPVVSIFGPTSVEQFRPRSPRPETVFVLKKSASTADVTPNQVVEAAYRLTKQHAQTISY